ncbi:hypothetical protein [Paenibacillus elgii]|uniref:Uncharacterized protein n=1 Tax=Paenibacillus elgii TaxID=189691 RepID=A0A165Q252_9BACL|nr:hypothetical protein [Paenibacillus elgii]KZE73402.1 hypothetical protein AV654_32510 [Paenibacillus elgii]MCM3273576.1 hypothetical protein [Paenibacillus elgii]NEN82615.1 hypothetical protein [Paenibacillus elgii]
MDWNGIFIIALVIINFPVYRFIYKLIFSDPEDFDESVKFSFTPDFISFFRGKYWQDKWGTFKLRMYILSCLVVVLLEYMLLSQVIGYFH